jgi:uncharacterized protein (DUF488 family)
MKEKLQIWTVGHSNRSIDTFLELLGEHGVHVLVDARSFPTSKIEHFEREEREKWLSEHGIEYASLVGSSQDTVQVRAFDNTRNEGKFLV